jgi:hypothetical protein
LRICNDAARFFHVSDGRRLHRGLRPGRPKLLAGRGRFGRRFVARLGRPATKGATSHTTECTAGKDCACCGLAVFAHGFRAEQRESGLRTLNNSFNDFRRGFGNGAGTNAAKDAGHQRCANFFGGAAQHAREAQGQDVKGTADGSLRNSGGNGCAGRRNSFRFCTGAALLFFNLALRVAADKTREGTKSSTNEGAGNTADHTAGNGAGKGEGHLGRGAGNCLLPRTKNTTNTVGVTEGTEPGFWHSLFGFKDIALTTFATVALKHVDAGGSTYGFSGTIEAALHFINAARKAFNEAAGRLLFCPRLIFLRVFALKDLARNGSRALRIIRSNINFTSVRQNNNGHCVIGRPIASYRVRAGGATPV